MSLNTEYLGETIWYSENEDKWECHALSLSEAKLSTLKAKIADRDKAMRRVKRVAAFYIHYTGIDPVAITLRIDATHCWIEKKDGRREKVSYADLVLATPDNSKLIDDYLALRVATQAANRTLSQKLAAIPRIAREDLEQSS